MERLPPIASALFLVLMITYPAARNNLRWNYLLLAPVQLCLLPGKSSIKK
jgi:hypothetical protein